MKDTVAEVVPESDALACHGFPNASQHANTCKHVRQPQISDLTGAAQEFALRYSTQPFERCQIRINPPFITKCQ